MIIDMIMGFIFLVSFSFFLKGAYLIVCDKQQAWNDKKNKSPPPGG